MRRWKRLLHRRFPQVSAGFLRFLVLTCVSLADMVGITLNGIRASLRRAVTRPKACLVTYGVSTPFLRFLIAAEGARL